MNLPESPDSSSGHGFSHAVTVTDSVRLQPLGAPGSLSSSILKNPEFVIPNGVCGVRNLSFLGILIEEGFLASLGMTGECFFSNPLVN